LSLIAAPRLDEPVRRLSAAGRHCDPWRRCRVSIDIRLSASSMRHAMKRLRVNGRAVKLVDVITISGAEGICPEFIHLVDELF
jgi:hypothetical protein